MARLATGIAGGMLAEGGRQIAQGRMPRASELLLTPANARRLAGQLANLRGAAMKMGQLLSMDAGDLLPPQLSEILARLRPPGALMPRREIEGAPGDRDGVARASLAQTITHCACGGTQIQRSKSRPLEIRPVFKRCAARRGEVGKEVPVVVLECELRIVGVE